VGKKFDVSLQLLWIRSQPSPHRGFVYRTFIGFIPQLEPYPISKHLGAYTSFGVSVCSCKSVNRLPRTKSKSAAATEHKTKEGGKTQNAVPGYIASLSRCSPMHSNEVGYGS